MCAAPYHVLEGIPENGVMHAVWKEASLSPVLHESRHFRDDTALDDAINDRNLRNRMPYHPSCSVLHFLPTSDNIHFLEMEDRSRLEQQLYLQG